MLPQFIIIGGQKCASTYLQYILIQHPNVYMPKQEIPFFQKPDYDPDNIKDYFNKLCKEKEKIFGIKRPNYLGTVGVEKRIAKHIPNIKLILILRNPTDRLRSAYFHYMKMGFIPIEELNKGVKSLLDKKYTKNYPRSKELINYGLYFKHITKYLKYFPKKNLKVFFYDDLKENSKKVVNELLNFIELDTKVKLDLSVRPQKGIYSLKRLRFRKYYLPLLYSYNNECTRLYEKDGLGKKIGNLLVVFNSVVLAKLFKQNHPKFNSEIKKRLIAIYKKDIFQLQKLFNKNLEHWLN